MAYGADCAHRRCALPSEPDPASSRSPNLAPTDAESGATERAGHNQCVARRRAPRDRNATQHAHVGYRRIMRTDGHVCLSSPSLAQPLPGGPRRLLVDRVPGSTVPTRREMSSSRPPRPRWPPGRRVSSADPRRQNPTVTRSTRLDDGEQRLAALWEYELDDAAADAKTADDVIAALFSSSPDGEAQTNQRASTSRTRRSTSRASGQRRHARARPHRAHLPHRLLGAGAAVAATFALLIVTPDWFGEHSDNVATKARPQAGHAATAVARGRAAQPERTVRDSRTVRRHHRRPATKQAPEVARPRRKPSRAAHRERDPPTPPPSRSPSARPLAEPAPPHARRVPSVAPTSSACDEFPPC